MSEPRRRIPLAMAMVYGSNPEFFKDEQIARLKRENERLRRAGDAMASELTEEFIGRLLIKEWEAAKGVQS